MNERICDLGRMRQQHVMRSTFCLESPHDCAFASQLIKLCDASAICTIFVRIFLYLLSGDCCIDILLARTLDYVWDVGNSGKIYEIDRENIHVKPVDMDARRML